MATSQASFGTPTPATEQPLNAVTTDTPCPLSESSAEPSPLESLDPRIRRTRELLQQALAHLLESREFEKLSVQEITDAAGLNRATFYAHYPDKFALLECMAAARFHALLADRGVVFDGTCSGALRGIVLGVCDYLAQNQMAPHLESAIVAVVRNLLLEGIQRHPPASGDAPTMLAATASWAIYGAAKEWVTAPNRISSDDIAATVQRLVAPLLNPASPGTQLHA